MGSRFLGFRPGESAVSATARGSREDFGVWCLASRASPRDVCGKLLCKRKQFLLSYVGIERRRHIRHALGAGLSNLFGVRALALGLGSDGYTPNPLLLNHEAKESRTVDSTRKNGKRLIAKKLFRMTLGPAQERWERLTPQISSSARER